MLLACENIRFSSLFAAGDVSRGGYSARNVPIGEERGETKVFAGYNVIFLKILDAIYNVLIKKEFFWYPLSNTFFESESFRFPFFYEK